MPAEQPSAVAVEAEDPVVAALPQILSFTPGPGLGEIRRRFMLLCSEGLGRWLAVLQDADPTAGATLTSRLGELSGDAFVRVLLAPETVRRLLWPELHGSEEVGRFLWLAIEAEHARSGNAAVLDGPTWTALGDELVGADGGARTLALHDFPPIVLGDPSFRHPAAAAAGPGEDDGLLAPDDLTATVTRLREAQLRVRKADERIWAFARELNTTLVLRTGREGETSFASSSPERYVGRSILWNPHATEVEAADLAEALVHEAIHTVLDSADALLSRATPASPRWITDPALYDGVSRTASAWTGRELDVPTYVHAYLVWYGLMCFWTRAYTADAFGGDTARRRIMRAGLPFMTRSALTPLRPFMEAIRPDMAALLEGIEEQVAEEFAGLTSEASA
jgi:hypothetical protein